MNVASAPACGIYLYCFFEDASGCVTPGELGIDSERPLELVRHNGVVAVAAEVPLAEYCRPEWEGREQELRWLLPRLQQHRQVIDRLRAQRPVLPVRFGTIFRSRDRIQQILADRCREIRRQLKRFEGKEEWGVKVYVRPAMVQKKARRINPILAKVQKQLKEVSPGRAYFHQKKLEATRREAYRTVEKNLARQIGERLQHDEKPCLSKRLFEKELTGRPEPMLLNSVFLVDTDKVANFRADVDRISQRFASWGCIFEVSGPWPPYSFCSALGDIQQEKSSGDPNLLLRAAAPSD